MNPEWKDKEIRLKFQLSDVTLFSKFLHLKTSENDFITFGNSEITSDLLEISKELNNNCEGYFIRSYPVDSLQPRLRYLKDFICYIPAQYQRYFIDMKNISFDEYIKKFSSKSRSTLKRKIKKFSEYCNGTTDFRYYRKPSEMTEFYRLAREVSVKTYQEKLLNSGLPDTSEFKNEMNSLAMTDSVRGYLLFHNQSPVSYLYCPIWGKTVIYNFLGYDSDYRKWSVGTILQWFALKQLFSENRFDLFDFTEGEGEHKSFFSTDSQPCVNVFFLRHTAKNVLIVLSHLLVSHLSETVGIFLTNYGLKAQIKQIIRFGI